MLNETFSVIIKHHARISTMYQPSRAESKNSGHPNSEYLEEEEAKVGRRRKRSILNLRRGCIGPKTEKTKTFLMHFCVSLS